MFRTVQMMDVNDWDALVQKTYGKPYSFQQQDGCKERGTRYFIVPCGYPEDYKNDIITESTDSNEMGVSFKAWLGRDPAQKLSEDDWDSTSALPMWYNRNFYPNVDMIINDLNSRGLLPEGDYCIDINW